MTVTIKILRSTIDSSLSSYLSKLKTIKSDHVIKIYDLIIQENCLAIVT
jgi:DNA-binding protein Fis